MRPILTALLLILPIAASAENFSTYGNASTGFVSTKNSTATTLGASETYTGDAELVAGYSQINCFAYSDVASALNGWTLELSTDGTNWDRKKQLTVNAAESSVHTLAVVTKYFRTVYINGSGAQSAFRLQCILGAGQNNKLTSSANQILADQVDVQVTRPSSTHDLDVARGLYEGQSWVNKFGKNASVGTSTEAIWSSGGDYTGFVQSAVSVEVLSSDVDDDTDGAGTNNGARTIKIQGLDANWAVQTSDAVTLDGTSTVSVPGTWMRVNRAWVETVGACSTSTPSTTCTNEGTITIRVASAGATLATIDAGQGQSEMAIYTVPAGKTAYLREIAVTVSTSANKTADVQLFQRRNVDETSPFYGRRVVWEEEDVSGATVELFDYSVQFPEHTDIWFTGNRADNTDAAIDADFELLLVPNDALPAIP